MRKQIVLLMLMQIAITANVFSQSQGPNDPGTANFSANGCLSCPGGEWSNYNNIMIADGLFATVQLSADTMCFQTTCFYSRYLMAYNFGFTIPISATITGVKAEMLSMTGTSSGIGDTIVHIFIPSSLGINHASPLPWTPNLVNIIYGDSIDLWGLPLTPDSVNQTGFGFRVMIRNSMPVTTIAPSSVDHITMTVYYSMPTGIFSQTRTANNFSLIYDEREHALNISSVTEQKINTFSVFDLLGKEIFSCHDSFLTSEKKRFYLPDLREGIYFVIIENAGGKRITSKFSVK